MANTEAKSNEFHDRLVALEERVFGKKEVEKVPPNAVNSKIPPSEWKQVKE